MQIDLPATLTATYSTYGWFDGDVVNRSHVAVKFGDELIAVLKPVREFENAYDTRYNEEQERDIANETLAEALKKLFALIKETS